MDVKDITINKPSLNQSTTASKEAKSGSSPNSQQRSAQNLSQTVAQDSPVTLKLTNARKPALQTNQRERINQVIGKVQETEEAIASLATLAKSISGIVDQADQNSSTAERRNALASEANQLVEEIRNTGKGLVAGIPSSQTDEVRLEVEKSLSDALSAIFPDSEDGFGIGAVELDPPAVIIGVRTNVRVARNRIEAIGESVSSVRQEVEETLVAFENSTASQSSVRDLEAAINLANQAEQRIERAPEKAIASVGALDPDATENLLK